ncbi:MAG: chromosome segregation protein SMC [Sphingobium sp.]|nr:chromosome segregation protein SMC [Sphingobium sp.]MBP6110924.1 chromosome segregation protein SMC [Sphingobium sp.]MBP8670622.1 chromosome segregation protein SMC [Sphingobium sp.]MBP9157004.1 chromosome segregation protein SMC [Sphingobium sp.]MCC6481682.1 chromosome segregation protein SMC [Sphingomonadaceae bacterium]
MEIRRLKLSGFKSFVEPTELRVEPGLTGIVGPNGCGKSNLLEAIRWVMGEASARSMRGGGMEDVIFAGTATRPQRDFAEVMLMAAVAPGETIPAIEVGADGELEVVRRIERGAGSAYRANGRDVRAKDVALLFADAATGAHSPALVSQGKIAAVIAARPQERRAMLEEAAGIAGLHVRRKDAEQKLRAAESNLTRLDEILADMDLRAAALRRQAKAAERYTRLSEQIRVAEARALYARWREADAAAAAAQTEAKTRDEAVRSAQERQAAAAAHAHAATDTLAKARGAAQATRDAANDAGHRLAALKARQEEAERRLADLDAQARRLAEDRAREDALAHDAADAITRLSEEVAALKKRIAAAESAMPGYAARISAAQEQARDAELELAKAMAHQAGEQAELKVAQAALSAAQGRLERAERDARRLVAELATIPDTEPLAALRDAAEAEADTAQTRKTELECALGQAVTERDAAAQARSEAESALSAARAVLAALEGEHQALVRALGSGTAAKDRLLDHVKAAPGYEHALAAALGDELEAGLDDSAARHWGGAETRVDDPALPAGAHALLAHISAPAALARRLAQIVVVEADKGQMLAVGQRLVTKDGALRRWDGFAARGGDEAAGAATAQRLVRVNRLEALGAQMPVARTTLSQAEAVLAEAVGAASAADASITRLRADLTQTERSLAAASRIRDDASAQIDRLAARREDVATRARAAEAELAATLAEHQAAQASCADMPDGAETRALVASLSRASEAAHAQASQLQADHALAERALGTDRARIADAEGEIRRWKSRSGEAGKRLADMTAREREIGEEHTELKERPAMLAGQAVSLAEESAGLVARASAAQAAESAAEAALRSIEDVLAQAGEALANAREARAGAAARAEAALAQRVETNRLCGDRFACPPPVLPERMGFESAGIGTAQAEQAGLERLTQERERIGPVNLIAAQELAELEAQQETSRTESAEIAQAINQLRGSIGSLNREGRARLLAAFEAVDQHFRRLFTALFNGGQARLELIESDDPLEAGLEILAQPPGKKLSTLTLLSGGEQALTAVALIFGLFLTNPAPICVLDEVDAPLDDANVERFCDLLDQMVRDTNTRYLIVTHNAVTMARMHRLFGVTMIEKGISRLVSVDLGGAEELLAAE